jgi:hypothetical protein
MEPLLRLLADGSINVRGQWPKTVCLIISKLLFGLTKDASEKKNISSDFKIIEHLLFLPQFFFSSLTDQCSVTGSALNLTLHIHICMLQCSLMFLCLDQNFMQMTRRH